MKTVKLPTEIIRVRLRVVFAYYIYSYRRIRSRVCRTCAPPPGPGCRPSRTRPCTFRTVVHCVKDRLQNVRTFSDMFELTQAFISSVFYRSTFIFSLAYSLIIVFKTKIQKFIRPESPSNTIPSTINQY
jgi:hypothetical protein